MRESDTRDAGAGDGASAGAGACAARRAFPEGATSATLRTTQELLAKHGTRLVLCGLVDPVRAELDRDGIIDLVGTTTSSTPSPT